MKFPLHLSPIRLLILGIWGLLAITLTTQSDRVPLVQLMTHSIGSTDLGDAVGHAGLFGVLTLATYLVIVMRLKQGIALLLSMSIALLLGAVTEFAQIGVLSRVASISDLLANTLGIFVVGFVISYLAFLRSRP